MRETKKRGSRLLTVFILLLVGISPLFLQETKTYALEKTILAKGREGKCNWKINGKGRLTITINGDYAEPTEGLDESELRNFYYMTGHLEPAWCDYTDRICSVKIKKGKGKLTNTIGMFYRLRVAPDKYDLKELDTSSVTDMTAMFMDVHSIPKLSVLDTSKVKSMKYMFCNSRLDKSSLKYFNGFDTSSVVDVSHMFQGADYIPDLRKLKFSSAKTMAYMFYECRFMENSVEHIKRLDTSNVEDMTGMFGDCWGNKLDLEGYDTSKVRKMDGMFMRATYGSDRPPELKELNLASFDTSNVESMEKMFSNNPELRTLDLRSFDMRNVKNMSRMFAYCGKLENLYILPEKWCDWKEGFEAGGAFEECGLSYGEQFQKYLYAYSWWNWEEEDVDIEDDVEKPSRVLTDYFTPQIM